MMRANRTVAGVPLTYAIETYGLTKRFSGLRKVQDWLRYWGRLDAVRAPARRRDEGILAVQDVTFHVRHGELFGLLGPNGAGKTTLIKLLATLIVPTAGTARVNGYDLRAERQVQASIGLVTGNERSFYWRLTGRENLRFYAILSGLSPAQAQDRIAELSAILDLDEFLDRRFDQYSSGMKQRLALARGMLHEPQILFLDEPTASLDPVAAARLRQTIRDLVREHGHTVLLVTHNLHEAEQLCDRVAIMHRGRLQVVDAVEKLRRLIQPQDRYLIEVAGLTPWAVDRLHRLDGVASLNVEPPTTDQPALVDICLHDSRQHLPAVMQAIVESGGQIQRCRTEEASLDEVFQRFTMTSGDGAEDVGAPAEPAPPGLPAEPAAVAARPDLHLRQGLRTALAFLRRDFRLQTSYRLSFVLQIAGILFSLASFYFVAQLFGQAVIPQLQAYGGDYFAFVLVGVAFMGYQGVAMTSFSDTIRSGQMMGTLEAMLVTPTRLSTILVSSSLWSFAFTSFQVLLYLFLGMVLFGLHLDRVNLMGAILAQILTILAFSGIGILSASFIMVFKQGNPINILFGAVSGLLAGVMYPIEVLPTWLQPLSYLVPLTYSLRAMRRAVLRGDSLETLAPDLLALAAFAVVTLPLSFLAFRFAVRRAKVEGSLTQF